MKLLLLLCLGLTLVSAHDEGNHDVVTSNFDMSKISGEWYTIQLASDDKEMIEKDSVRRGFTESIQAWDNSSLTLKFHVKVNGECTEIFLVCHQATENGVYNVIYAGFNTFRIIEVVYSDYIMFHLINVNNENTFEMLILLARKPDVSPKLKERFEELCQEYGIAEENILDATKVDRCLQARGSQDAEASRLVMSDGAGVARGPCLPKLLGYRVNASSPGLQDVHSMVLVSACDKVCDLISITIIQEGIISESLIV